MPSVDKIIMLFVSTGIEYIASSILDWTFGGMWSESRPRFFATAVPFVLSQTWFIKKDLDTQIRLNCRRWEVMCMRMWYKIPSMGQSLPRDGQLFAFCISGRGLKSRRGIGLWLESILFGFTI